MHLLNLFLRCCFGAKPSADPSRLAGRDGVILLDQAFHGVTAALRHVVRAQEAVGRGHLHFQVHKPEHLIRRNRIPPPHLQQAMPGSHAPPRFIPTASKDT